VPIIKNTPNWDDIQNKPSTFPPDTHASNHASGGSDEITPADIGAAAASHASQHAAGGSDPITPADIEAVAQAADYDSGWFAVTTGTTYTLDHNFGKLPSNIIVIFRKDSSYSFYTFADVFKATDELGFNYATSTSQIKIRTASTYVSPVFSNFLDSTDALTASGEYRVLVWK